jgi:mevalonate kinase
MYELSVGSKVFLLGEYQVLDRGSAFLTVLEPRFKLIVKAGSGQVEGIPGASPARKVLEIEKPFFQNWDLQFVDPHAGRGGFGASTAQFGLLQGFRESIDSFKSQAQLNFDLRKIHKKYLELAKLQTGLQPSGADLISQYQGGMVEVDLGAGKIQRHAWPFPQWQILFFATGNKQATHEHLRELKEVDLSQLRALYGQAMDAFRERSALAFLQGVREYQQALLIHGWQSTETTKILNMINSVEGVEASKGCGAMGADVIAVIVNSAKVEELSLKISAMGLRYIGNLENRTEGFAWKWLPQNTMVDAAQEDSWN